MTDQDRIARRRAQVVALWQRWLHGVPSDEAILRRHQRLCRVRLARECGASPASARAERYACEQMMGDTDQLNNRPRMRA